ncbi:hypothetical protein OBBRIDRAFT_809207 [Obba rivulosa]|uniref:Proline-rich protein HUA1 n=1 Tax=Obba rivulosa TaxID=1052685 RepID=A0A8E2DUZ6_9APHY|nr:hypothetical protein OBBRIDRAFT_809207 [Obba rivulosa]
MLHRTPSPHQGGSRGATPARSDDLLAEELPPAYTPAPDVVHGEATIELGPRRPFQQPPRHPQHWPQQQYLSPDAGPWLSPQAIGSGWSEYPGQVHRHVSGGAYAVPPPIHPSSTGGTRSAGQSPIDPRAVSDFARDFYAVGADTRGPVASSGSPYGTPPSPPSTGRYAPPPGLPPRPPPSSGSRPGGTPDDGRPTTVPVPGHPLLRNNKLLEYPAGYECPKCRNTGYKNNDPSHPCSRCWEKYGQPYIGALTCMPWPASNSSTSRHTYQRPLPRFSPPQQSFQPGHRSSSSYPGSAPSQTQGTVYGLPGPPPKPIVATRPPPGAQVYPAGDPRLGGRLCWNCSGRGRMTFFGIDLDSCPTCDGIGRTY